MTKLLINLFVKNSEDTTSMPVRESYGRLAGITGIASNLLLFLLKLISGWISGSISILADAMNNLSDCASSTVTLVGFKIAAKPADEHHPYGHARVEYISGLIVSFLVMLIGFELFISSVRKIIDPTAVEFSRWTVVILSVSILLKLWQSLFNRHIGKRIDSTALIATATDSLNDVITTTVVLAGAILTHFTGLNLDGWMGALVALFILISGIRLVGETVSPLLGLAPDTQLVNKIEEKILGYDTVIGLHDLIVHNYGPGHIFASVHVEFPACQDILISHDIIDNIERDFKLKQGIEMVIHLDPIVTDNEQLSEYKKCIQNIIKEIDPALSIHDFRMVDGKSHTNLIFDLVVPSQFQIGNKELRLMIVEKARKTDPDLYCVVTIDRSYISSQPQIGPH